MERSGWVTLLVLSAVDQRQMDILDRHLEIWLAPRGKSHLGWRAQGFLGRGCKPEPGQICPLAVSVGSIGPVQRELSKAVLAQLEVGAIPSCLGRKLVTATHRSVHCLRVWGRGKLGVCLEEQSSLFWRSRRVFLLLSYRTKGPSISPERIV